MSNNYILIETNNSDSTFIKENRYYEIYQLPSNIENIDLDESTLTFVNAINQSDAFKKFRSSYPKLLKKTTKNFKDTTINLDVE